MNEIARPPQLRTVISAEQIQKRVREMGRQISDDYRGQSIHLLALLENAFIFMADLVRALEVPVVCQSLRSYYRISDERSESAGRGLGQAGYAARPAIGPPGPVAARLLRVFGR